MPKYVTVEAHLSLDELAHLYRKAVDPVERNHFHIIWLLAQGKRGSSVAQVTGYCLNWIRILARRYNQEGAQVLADHLHVRNQEILIGCCCPRSMSRFSPLLWSSLHRLLVLARIGASSWY